MCKFRCVAIERIKRETLQSIDWAIYCSGMRENSDGVYPCKTCRQELSSGSLKEVMNYDTILTRQQTLECIVLHDQKVTTKSDNNLIILLSHSLKHSTIETGDNNFRASKPVEQLMNSGNEWI